MIYEVLLSSGEMVEIEANNPTVLRNKIVDFMIQRSMIKIKEGEKK